MPKVEFKGLDEILLSMQEVAALPEEVIDEMLNARADVVVAAQQAEARKLGSEYRNKKQKKSYATGTTAISSKKGKIKVKDGTRMLYVTPAGSRTRGKKKKTTTRNAEIAFLNEFGTRTINARNFIRTANERSAEAATAAELAVYDRFLGEKGL